MNFFVSLLIVLSAFAIGTMLGVWAHTQLCKSNHTHAQVLSDMLEHLNIRADWQHDGDLITCHFHTSGNECWIYFIFSADGEILNFGFGEDISAEKT